MGSLGEFLEYGQYEGSLYGLPYCEIEKLVSCPLNPLMPVLDVEPSSLLKLRTIRSLTPLLTVFIKPPEPAEEGCGPLSKLQNESRLLYESFKPYLDEHVVNDGDIELVAQLVKELVHCDAACNRLRWLPLSWVYD